MSDMRLNPCHCGRDHFQIAVSRSRVTIFCPQCGASHGTLPRNGLASYTTIGNARRYLLPKAIAEWNSYHKPEEDAQ